MPKMLQGFHRMMICWLFWNREGIVGLFEFGRNICSGVEYLDSRG